MDHPGAEPLRRHERWGVALFLLLVVAFGALVELRSAYLSVRRTDIGCYLRAAWAVRTGENIYAVTDDNGWHYAYPPVVAVLLTPFADAPAAADRSWMLPYPVTVALWYALSVLALLLAVHWIVSALESSSPNPALRETQTGRRRWWYHRLFPIAVCIAQVGGTLSRGQVTLFLILLVAGAFAATVRGRRIASGVWLAAAVCLKIIPGFLLLVPLWRRDRRALAGVGIGMAAGIVVIPSLVWGVEGAWRRNLDLVQAVIRPALAEGGDQTRATELIEMTATDNQSFQATFHNYLHWGPEELRPPQPSPATRLAHWGAGAALTLLTLLAFGRGQPHDPIRELLLLGSLLLLMAHISPVSHIHYFCLAIVLVIGLLFHSMAHSPSGLTPSVPMLVMVCASGVGYALASIPFWEHRREAGFPMWTTLLLWAVAVRCLYQTRTRRAAASPPAVVYRQAG